VFRLSRTSCRSRTPRLASGSMARMRFIGISWWCPKPSQVSRRDPILGSHEQWQALLRPRLRSSSSRRKTSLWLFPGSPKLAPAKLHDLEVAGGEAAERGIQLVVVPAAMAPLQDLSGILCP
jgi:hypothetical protein